MARTGSAFDRLGDENALAVLARAGELAQHGRDIVDLTGGVPAFRTPEHIVEAAARALRDGHHGATDPLGLPALREALAAYLLATHGVAVPADRLLVVPGSRAAMLTAITLVGRPGVDVVHPDPGFPLYRSMIEFSGARPVPVALRERAGFAPTAADVLAAITPATRLVIVNSPGDPAGGVMTPAEVSQLVTGLLDHPRVAVLADEGYDRLVYDDAEHVSLLSYPAIRNRLIVVNGFSKAYAMSGWRLGWSVWPRSLVEAVRRYAVHAWGCVNTPAQHGGVAALTGPPDCVHDMVAALDRRRRLAARLLASLPGVSCLQPQGACFAFPNIAGTGWSAPALAEALLEYAGVAVLAGTDFGPGGAGHLRVSYAAGEDDIRLAVTRIGDFLDHYG